MNGSQPHTSSSTGADSEERCANCKCDLLTESPDLDQLQSNFGGRLAPSSFEDWCEAEDSGCSFCNIVLAIYRDACAKFRPSDYPEPQKIFVQLTRDHGRYLMVMVIVEEFHYPHLGSIVVYLDGERIWASQGVFFFFGMLADLRPENDQNFSDSETPKLKLVPYASIQQRAFSIECFHLANRWLRNCRANHSECARDIGGEFKFPIRLIDISKDVSRVVVFNVDRRREVSYVALSHCWGDAQPLTTVKSNLDKHMRSGIEKTDFPETFRNAVDISRSLGFRYIWIDSLCIVQDDRQDWEEQSSQMACMYGKADLVLGAAVAASARDGFLGSRPPFREFSIRIPSRQGRGAPLSLRYRVRPWQDTAKADPLDTRGWALQERLMAKRYLAYGGSEMYWVCICSVWCECDCYMFETRHWEKIRNIDKILPREVSSIGEIGPYWRSKVLIPYSFRRLTKSIDKLVALSAVASLFQARFKANYLAGLWKEDLIRELLWKSFDSREARAESSYAPSWSWASVSLEGQWYSYPLDEGNEEPLAEVLEASTDPSTINPFGPVSGGVIKLSAVTWPATVGFDNSFGFDDSEMVELSVDGLSNLCIPLGGFDTPLAALDVTLEDGTRERVPRRLKTNEVIGDFREADGLPIIAVPILLSYDKQQAGMGPRRVQGLLLGRSVSDTRYFERLGTFIAQNISEEEVILLKGMQQEPVVII